MKVRTVILTLLLSGIGASGANSRAVTPKLIPAFNKASKGINYGTHPRNHIYWEVRRVSPDRKFVACILGTDGELGLLRIYRYDEKNRKPRLGKMLTSEIVDVGGCVWVPNHQHWLAFSTGGIADYSPQSKGKIALWTGNSVRFLRKAKAQQEEGFNIRSVSSNGGFLIYEHFGLNSPDPNYHRNTYLKLYLPRQ